MRNRFHKLAHHAALACGSPFAFLAACLIVVVWAATGPLFDFSDTWQLVINTGTTILTFLIVFLIQATQNRDSRAIHLKLDEVIRAVRDARNSLIKLEQEPEEELDRVEEDLRSQKG